MQARICSLPFGVQNLLATSLQIAANIHIFCNCVLTVRLPRNHIEMTFVAAFQAYKNS